MTGQKTTIVAGTFFAETRPNGDTLVSFTGGRPRGPIRDSWIDTWVESRIWLRADGTSYREQWTAKLGAWSSNREDIQTTELGYTLSFVGSGI